MPAPTLVSMAQRNLIRNISDLQDVGDIPYEALRPALRKIVDPHQLRTIELASPQIADADSELWIAFIKRDVPNWKDKMAKPKNPRSWWKVYRKLYNEEMAAQEEQQRQLKEAFSKKKEEREENSTHILNSTVYQRFRQGQWLDGKPNPNYRSYGFERAGSVASAKKGGKNVIAAIRKAAMKPTPFKVPTNNAATSTQHKMWQEQPLSPGVRPKDPNKLHIQSKPNMAAKTAKSAFDRALKEDERIKAERTKKRGSTSPPPWDKEPAASPAKQQAAPTASMQLAAATSPPRMASPAVPSNVATLGPGVGTKRTMSPANAGTAPPPQKRPRPQTSIFMPKRAIKR